MLKYFKPKTIAEIGCNHKGDIELAFDLIKLAKDCGAEIAKFQKRNNKELLSEDQYNAPHPNPINSYGNTYGEHREYLEFDVEQHKQIKEFCENLDIEYSTSVWDVTSAKEMSKLNPRMLKVPSASNTHFDMLEILRDEYKGEVHISFGMTTHEEEKKVIAFFNQNGISKERLIIYSCTSGYPVPFNDLCLLEIKRLQNDYNHIVKSIGFSGHHLGIAVDVAAYTLGAQYIERHFTKDRTWKGTDHAASLEPTGFKKLTRDLNATYESLQFKSSELLDIELPQREKLKFKI